MYLGGADSVLVQPPRGNRVPLLICRTHIGLAVLNWHDSYATEAKVQANSNLYAECYKCQIPAGV